MNRDWLFETDAYVCGVRTIGVLLRDGNIWVQKDRGGDVYALPGGHIHIGETLEDGLVREYKEETGADIRCQRFLWSEECFWAWNGKQAHQLAYYYLIELCADAALPDNDFIPLKDNSDVVMGWLPLAELPNVFIYPVFLEKEIHRLSEAPKHFVYHE